MAKPRKFWETNTNCSAFGSDFHCFTLCCQLFTFRNFKVISHTEYFLDLAKLHLPSCNTFVVVVVVVVVFLSKQESAGWSQENLLSSSFVSFFSSLHELQTSFNLCTGSVPVSTFILKKGMIKVLSWLLSNSHAFLKY